MPESGNSSVDLGAIGISPRGPVVRNAAPSALVDFAVRRGEGGLASNGALVVNTGKYTGRSPKDKYLVKGAPTESSIWWGDVNRTVSRDIFDQVFERARGHIAADLDGAPVFVFDGRCGDSPSAGIAVRFVTRKAWQALFVHNMFLRPTPRDLNEFAPDFTVLNASGIENVDWELQGLHSETFIGFDLNRRLGLIVGSEYAGEMKKGIFSVMNYFLPMKGILTMHCSANVNRNGGNCALFFGLSGTGKTTLSTDPNRLLVGDDEHAWDDAGVFNLEGGCYAKAIGLSQEMEPGIWAAVKHGSLLENVVVDPQTGVADYSNDSRTENTRISYPLDFIPDSLASFGRPSRAGHPETILFLSCDAYGVLPPISRLSPRQALYHFISGYTAKVAGTERGVVQPEATFSPCFGGPFMTLHPLTYARMLEQKLQRHRAQIFLINTGWSGGRAGSGVKRISLRATRAMVTAALTGAISQSEFVKEPVFGLDVPTSVEGVDSRILWPRNAWASEEGYDSAAGELAKKFVDNTSRFLHDEPDLRALDPAV